MESDFHARNTFTLHIYTHTYIHTHTHAHTLDWSGPDQVPGQIPLERVQNAENGTTAGGKADDTVWSTCVNVLVCTDLTLHIHIIADIPHFDPPPPPCKLVLLPTLILYTTYDYHYYYYYYHYAPTKTSGWLQIRVIDEREVQA